MRLSLLACLLSTVFIAGCAQEGVIVQKNSSPQPFYHSLGIDGSYTFLLRDRAGSVHRQLVTPEVFERYAVGDYFNDLQPGPARASDGKNMVTATAPEKSRQRVARVQKAAKSRHTAAAHQRKARKNVSRRTKHRAPASKIVRVQRKPRVAKAKEAQLLFVSVVRCR